MGQVGFSQSPNLKSSQLIIFSLELTFAIMAACIPTIRPLFRSLDGKKPGMPNQLGQAVIRQGNDDRDRDFYLHEAFGQNIQHRLMIPELSYRDSRSERSVQLFTNPDTTTKTREISVSAHNAGKGSFVS